MSGSVEAGGSNRFLLWGMIGEIDVGAYFGVTRMTGEASDGAVTDVSGDLVGM